MNEPDFDVLIVDDSRDAADSLTELMSLLGFRARAAYSAHEALQIVEGSQPLCVMLDVHMPDMDGLELAQVLRRKCGDDVVLVAVTGSGPDDERAAGVFTVVDHHFIKPVSVDELAKVLRA